MEDSTLTLAPRSQDSSSSDSTLSPAHRSGEHAVQSAPNELNAKSQSRFEKTAPLVTTRIGVVFFVTAVCALACGLTAHAVPTHPALHSMLWVTVVAICSLAGMISMRSVRTLQTIERELRRTTGQPERWKSVRPIIGNDSITEGWNELLTEAGRASQPSANSRKAADLDQEVITLARAMRGLPAAWVISDREGRIRFISSATCGLFNIADDAQHVGRDFLELLQLRGASVASNDNAEEREKAAEACKRLLSDVRMVRERRSLMIGATEIHLRIRRSILAGRSGDGQGLAWIINDVTQQEMATKARDQFLMTATHELRTPLNNLQAYAEALQEEDDSEVERQKEFCNVIVSESHRLGRLVDQLLTVGQMEAGSMVAHRHELELLPMVEYAADQMTAMAEKKNQSLLTDFTAKLPTVFGDRDKLQAALVNLVGNAVKYTQEGGEVIVRCGIHDRSIRIDVQDNGPGIPADEQVKVFEKFFRGSGAVDSDERGNGLGLAFTREVIRMHGGDIDLVSKVGEGSTFSVRLPVGGQSRSGI